MNITKITCFAAIVMSSMIFCSCGKDDGRFQEVDDRLVYLFEAFEEEAEQRGVSINLDTIEGNISQIIDPGILGLCQYAQNDGELNTITIDNRTWAESDSQFREFVVFHELGHCVLNRLHLDQQDMSGFCTSIMASGTANCERNYNEFTREEYLDELFQ